MAYKFADGTRLPMDVAFTHGDIQRNSIIKSVLMALEDEQDILR